MSVYPKGVPDNPPLAEEPHRRCRAAGHHVTEGVAAELRAEYGVLGIVHIGRRATRPPELNP